MLQQFIVFVIVAGASGYLFGRYAPLSLRRMVRKSLIGLATRLRFTRLAGWLEAQAEAGQGCATGCGPCQGCGPAKPAEPGITRTSITPDALKRTIVRRA